MPEVVYEPMIVDRTSAEMSVTDFGSRQQDWDRERSALHSVTKPSVTGPWTDLARSSSAVYSATRILPRNRARTAGDLRLNG